MLNLHGKMEHHAHNEKEIKSYTKPHIIFMENDYASLLFFIGII